MDVMFYCWHIGCCTIFTADKADGKVNGPDRRGVTMLVKDWMSKTVITVDINDSMQEAMKLLKDHGIPMLPVTKRGKLVEIITDRDLKRASPSDSTTLEMHELLYLISRIAVKEIMTEDPITIPFDFTVEEAAEILMTNKISGAPVMDRKDRIVGTIAKGDLFRVLISLTGMGKRGIQFAFQLEDRSGSIKEVADIIRQYNGRMVSILSTYEHVPKGFRKVFIRMYGVDRERLPSLEEELRKKAKILYVVDQRENRREIF